ncbi:MAG: NYN domain-containing protein [Fervidobacterium sp.]|uniref:TIGR00288 family protein n=1 Tax=Fervidobacterium gondwanense DSM 13020 TaxID=1121883 RepID=A0A1M7RYC6_FERGO|nr:NYN domain-containing protein [Fervidobacterium gondwanense]SHN51156.1 TIGR00288 family protein [Fervidobacterium gondwanense DSM 13020]
MNLTNLNESRFLQSSAHLNIFLLFDFQNQPVDVQLVYREAQKYGRIVGGKAYGSWSKHKMPAFALYNYGIELIEIPEAEFLPNKKGNDIRLAVDCIEQALKNDVIDTFFLVTGDADFTALVYKLKSYGKQVIAVARTKSTSYELVSAVDKFIPYEDIVKNENLTDPIDRLGEEMDIFLKRSGKNFTIENLSRFLASFNINPSKYGYNNITELAEEIYERKVQKPERLKNTKLLLIRGILYESLSEKTLPEYSQRHKIAIDDLKLALDMLLHDDVLKINDGVYELNRNKAFFAVLLEKYPILTQHFMEFLEKTYKAFLNGRVKALNQLLQSEFRLTSSEFKSYVEAVKRSGCLKGMDESDYISYSTPAKVVCNLEAFIVSSFAYYVKRILSQTFVFKHEIEYIKELVFSNDEKLFEKVLNFLITSGEITEIGGVYFYSPL